MIKKINFVVFHFLFFYTIYSSAINPEPILKIHYLGHSSFVLQFDNGINIVTDYGHYNAWIDSGWDSPIHNIGNLVPDVMTFSHFHDDHYDPDRIPSGVEHILTEFDSLIINGIEITPIRVCEGNINNEDNSAYLFKYKGRKFLHLGDAQGQIKQINNPSVRDHIKSIIPDSLDILFMTIEDQETFVEEAELFVNTVKPKRIIPMHYWTNRNKRNFLFHLISMNSQGRNYFIEEFNTAKYGIYDSDTLLQVEVISLICEPFSIPTSTKINKDIPTQLKLNQNYPNPFNPSTKINFSLAQKGNVHLRVFDLAGNEIETILNEVKEAGNYQEDFNGGRLPSGIYFYQLISNQYNKTKKMLLIH